MGGWIDDIENNFFLTILFLFLSVQTGRSIFVSMSLVGWDTSFHLFAFCSTILILQ